jgi:hypothetical protein
MTAHSLRLLVSGAFAVAIAAAPILPTSAPATTGGCVAPSLAVSLFLSNASGGFIFSDLSEDPGICGRQCSQMKKGCLQVAQGSFQCFMGDQSALYGSELAQCGELSGSEEQGCKTSQHGGKKNAQEFLHEDLRNAQRQCEDAHDECVSICNGGGKPE